MSGELSDVWGHLSEICPLHKDTSVWSQRHDTQLPAQPSHMLPAPSLQAKVQEGMGVSQAESLQPVPLGPKQSGQVLALLDQA